MGIRNSMKKRVMVIGWDCAAPELVFDAFKDDMPNTQRLMSEGIYGELKSTIPPITVPAWMCMMTSRDPGEIGIYGFRNRKDYSYNTLSIANANAVKVPTLWELLGQVKKRSVVLGVPLTYPAKPFPGWMITSFLTPGDLISPMNQPNLQTTFPPRLSREIMQNAPEYMIDIPNYRTDDREELEQLLIKMTRERFKLARYLTEKKAWDFFIMVEMGSDRLHHAFWRYWDRTHPKYEPDSQFTDTIRNYYQLLDEELGLILSLIDDETSVFIVSDHGAKKMDGGICVNEWLRIHGYLSLKSEPKEITPCLPEMIDWENTIAWGEGGYYGRIFINVLGREPQGIVSMEDYESVRDKLKEHLEAIVDESGEKINTRVFKPEEVYRECNNIPPDLIVYFGDLYWRSVGSVGYNSIYTYENDTGPDDCNHAEMGMFILKDGKRTDGLVSERSIYDIAPTILRDFGLDIPYEMQGKPIKVGLTQLPR